MEMSLCEASLTPILQAEEARQEAHEEALQEEKALREAIAMSLADMKL